MACSYFIFPNDAQEQQQLSTYLNKNQQQQHGDLQKKSFSRRPFTLSHSPLIQRILSPIPLKKWHPLISKPPLIRPFQSAKTVAWIHSPPGLIPIYLHFPMASLENPIFFFLSKELFFFIIIILFLSHFLPLFFFKKNSTTSPFANRFPCLSIYLYFYFIIFLVNKIKKIEIEIKINKHKKMKLK